MPPRSLSIIVSNFNYGRYLRECIDRALEQLGSGDELIVVDDGSTDSSGAIIQSYGRALHAIMQDNGGQASALNAGFAACQGDWVLFLDADDYLFPSALSEIRSVVTGEINRIIYPLELQDAQGRSFGMIPRNPSSMPSEKLSPNPISRSSLIFPPTSGNVFARAFLEKVMPIPPDQFRISADLYLSLSNLAEQRIGRLESPLGVYRVHDHNAFGTISQFHRSRKISFQRLQAIHNQIELIGPQIELQPNANAEDARLRLLALGQLKDLLLAKRLVPHSPEHARWSNKAIVAEARTKLGDLPSLSEKVKERLNLIALRHFPLATLPWLGRLEAFRKGRFASAPS